MDPLEMKPQRLLEVADKVLSVFDKASGVGSVFDASAKLIGDATTFEVDEAVKFLIRCGYVERVSH